MAGRASSSSFLTASQYAIRERRLLIAHRAPTPRRSPPQPAASQPGTGTAQQRGIRRHSAAWRAPPRGRAFPMIGRRQRRRSGDSKGRRFSDNSCAWHRGEALVQSAVRPGDASYTRPLAEGSSRSKGAPRLGCSCTSVPVALDARTHGGALTPRDRWATAVRGEHTQPALESAVPRGSRRTPSASPPS